MTGSSWANVCQSRSFHCLPPSRCDFWIKSKSWRLLFYMFGVESLICSLIAICICIRGFMVQRKCFLRPCFKRQRAKRWSLFTGHPALLLQGSLLLCPPSLSHFLPHSLLTLLPSEPLYISASLSLRGCHFLLSPSRSPSAHLIPPCLFSSSVFSQLSLCVSRPQTPLRVPRLFSPYEPPNRQTVMQLSYHNIMRFGAPKLKEAIFYSCQLFIEGGPDLFQCL